MSYVACYVISSCRKMLKLDLVQKTKRVTTPAYTTQHEYNTHNTRQKRVQHDTTRDNTSAPRDNTNTERHNTSTTQHKFYFDLFTSLLHTQNLVY